MVEYPPPVLTPDEYELLVKRCLDLDAAKAGLLDYQSQHKESIEGPDGEYEIDVTLRFSALGADYLTLVECKHYKRRVEREKVMALWAKLLSLGGHKGIMFSTAGFQSGAIEFAKAHGIALVELADGRTSYLIKSFTGNGQIPWDMMPPHVPKVVCWLVNGNARSAVGPTFGRSVRDLVPDIFPATANA
jgi:restriction system protein